jgi:hypothetical protein
MSTHTTHTSGTTIGNNWKQNSDTYTGDDLIDAFIRGKKAGRDEQKKILLERISQNVNKATQLSERLYQIAIDQKFKLFEIHIKAENISTYTALFLVDNSDFLSDRFRDIYTIARQLKNEAETDTFYISFSFTPKSEQLSEDCLAADGFFLKYEKKQRKA